MHMEHIKWRGVTSGKYRWGQYKLYGLAIIALSQEIWEESMIKTVMAVVDSCLLSSMAGG